MRVEGKPYKSAHFLRLNAKSPNVHDFNINSFPQIRATIEWYRREGMPVNFVRAFTAIKNLINPRNAREFCGLYIGSASDFGGFLYATNAQTGIFVDKSPFSLDRKPTQNMADDFGRYMTGKFVHGSYSRTDEVQSDMLAFSIGELLSIGAKKITVSPLQNGGQQFDFLWRHPSQQKPVARSITLHTADLNSTYAYFPLIGHQVDVIMEKALFSPENLFFRDSFRAPLLQAFLKENGFVVCNNSVNWRVWGNCAESAETHRVTNSFYETDFYYGYDQHPTIIKKKQDVRIGSTELLSAFLDPRDPVVSLGLLRSIVERCKIYPEMTDVLLEAIMSHGLDLGIAMEQIMRAKLAVALALIGDLKSEDKEKQFLARVEQFANMSEVVNLEELYDPSRKGADCALMIYQYMKGRKSLEELKKVRPSFLSAVTAYDIVMETCPPGI